MPKEILLHILTLANEPRVEVNLRSSCTKIYKALLAPKTQYIIKALPANHLEALSKCLSRATKPFELIVRSPPLALQKVPNKFMNTLTSLKNLTGLDITDWKDLPHPALQKLFLLTNLEALSGSFTAFDASHLSKLTKLGIPYSIYTTRMLKSLTNLQDLRVDLVEGVINVSALPNLTKLHFGFIWNASGSSFSVILTALTCLKDLKIKSQANNTKIQLKASCTTLESLNIEDIPEDMDVDWLASNTKLTHFNVKSAWDGDPEKYLALRNLREVSSASVYHQVQVPLFRNFTLTNLVSDVPGGGGFTDEEVLTFTSLRSLVLRTRVMPNFPKTFVHLTRLTIQQVYSPTKASLVTVPTCLKELEFCSPCGVQSLSKLTQLESLTLFQKLDFDRTFKASALGQLTRLQMNLSGAQQATLYLPKLSKLLSLKELVVAAPNNYQGVDTEFLLTLPNLELLDMVPIGLSLQVFNKFVQQQQNKVTQLRVNCSESNGEVLTRLTNLQILYFVSRQPMKGLKAKLEEILPRLGHCHM